MTTGQGGDMSPVTFEDVQGAFEALWVAERVDNPAQIIAAANALSMRAGAYVLARLALQVEAGALPPSAFELDIEPDDDSPDDGFE